MRLTHLAVDIHITEPSTADEKDKMIKLYQKLVTRIAIELHCLDWYWDHLEYNGWSILVVHVPFPESCFILCIEPIGMQGVFNTCKNLKYLTCQHARGEMFLTANCYSLQELCFHSETIEIFMSTISAHGGLVHVVLDVNSVTSEGISGVATIEATEAAASVKIQQQAEQACRVLAPPPGFSTQTLLDSITVPHIVESMAAGWSPW